MNLKDLFFQYFSLKMALDTTFVVFAIAGTATQLQPMVNIAWLVFFLLTLLTLLGCFAGTFDNDPETQGGNFTGICCGIVLFCLSWYFIGFAYLIVSVAAAMLAWRK